MRKFLIWLMVICFFAITLYIIYPKPEKAEITGSNLTEDEYRDWLKERYDINYDDIDFNNPFFSFD